MDFDQPIYRAYPFVGSGASSVSQEIADERAQEAAEAGAALITCPTVATYEATVTVTANCPEGSTGPASSATVTATSAISLEAAEAAATAQATEEAEAGLVCVPNEETFEGTASYTAHSQAGGTCTSITVEKTAHSLISVEDAEAIALAEAMAEAEQTLNGGVPSEVELVYASGGDTNDVAYFLGTNRGLASWTNPVVGGKFKAYVYPRLIVSGLINNEDWREFDRTSGDVYGDTIGGSMGINLGDKMQLRVSAYSHQSRSLDSAFNMRNWKLQGCFCIPNLEADPIHDASSELRWNSADWQDLDVHVNDATQTGMSEWMTTVGILDPRFFRYLRIVQTGKNASPLHPFYSELMMVSEMAFYGTLRTYP